MTAGCERGRVRRLFEAAFYEIFDFVQPPSNHDEENPEKRSAYWCGFAVNAFY